MIELETACLSSTEKFGDWLENEGYESYDPYDLWGTKYGCWSRRVYYEKGAIGLPFIAPVLLAEIFTPSVRKWFVSKCRFATADSQLVLAFLNLFETTGDEEWLRKAEDLARDLLGYSVEGFSGVCWGYPFDWQSKDSFAPKNTPFITTTPYCYEVFVRLSEVTKKTEYREVAQSIARFVAEDFTDTPMSEDAAACSYAPFGKSKVINASAYRAMVLLDAADRFDEESYHEKGMRNVRFILQSQQPDGSWFYEIKEGKSFIDNYHTCFNLKNLTKINRRLNSRALTDSVIAGFSYYKEALLHENGLPKNYSIEPRTQILKLEMYNIAEAITLGSVAKETLPDAFDLARDYSTRLINDYQLPQGYFITREYRGGIRHHFPFLRWPQAQLFYALTNMMVALGNAREVLARERDDLAVG